MVDDPGTGGAPRESMIRVRGADLYLLEMGRGIPVITLHGGPDFDHSYLRPELDRLSEACRLIYYDQRGRGRSAAGVAPEDVSMQSELEDLEALRQALGLEAAVLLGHSWGGLFALEYAIQHPERVSRLILMNSAPPSHDLFLQFREARRARSPADVAELAACSAERSYQEGDPDAVAAYYRIHFRAALARPEHLELLIERLRGSLTREGILKARTIEDRLYDDTWKQEGYDLLPACRRLTIPTLVLHSEGDFIPVDCVAPVAEAIAGARLVVLQGCGHFSYMERPDETQRELRAFLAENAG